MDKRVQQTVGHRAQHFVQVGFRTQLAREFDQRAAIIVTVLIKEVAIQLFLQPVADGLENECREQNQADDGGRTQMSSGRVNEKIRP